MLTTVELREAANELVYPSARDADLPAQRVAYYNQLEKLEIRWKEWLHEEYAPKLSTQAAAVLYTKAYQDGHASGYEEIENEYAELASLINKVKEIDG